MEEAMAKLIDVSVKIAKKEEQQKCLKIFEKTLQEASTKVFLDIMARAYADILSE